jgi:hypothetical protein
MNDLRWLNGSGIRAWHLPGATGAIGVVKAV